MHDGKTSAVAAVAAEPTTENEPVIEEPIAEESPLEEPAATKPPPDEHAPVEEPAAEEPPPDERAAVEEAAVEEPRSEEPAAEEPPPDEPVVIAEPAAVEEPAAEVLPLEEPAANEPPPEGIATASPEDEPQADAVFAYLQDIAIRVIELFIEWDDDNNGMTDSREFKKALPVLEVFVTSEEADKLFDTLCTDGTEIEHWALFRKLVASEGVDVNEAELEARAQLAESQTKGQTASSSPFWSRETGGKAVNRHVLRKRKVALQPWERQSKGYANEFSSGLRSQSPMTQDSDVGNVASRQLQNTKLLDPNATVQEQLLAALDEHLARVIELFRAWDENGDGNVSKKEFRRGLKLFGLSATTKEMDELFDEFDASGDEEIQFRELSRMIKAAAKKHTKSPPPNRLAPIEHKIAASAPATPRSGGARRPTRPKPEAQHATIDSQRVKISSPRLVPLRWNPPRCEGAIQRAMSGRAPHARGVNLEALCNAEASYRLLRDPAITSPRAALQRTPDYVPTGHYSLKRSPRSHQSSFSSLNGAMTRRGLKDLGLELSHIYNDIGTACMGTSPLVAQECLERALIISPRDHAVHPLSMCNLAALHLHLGASRVAIRYLQRAVLIDSTAPPSVRARVRLNLSSAYSRDGQIHEALECAREADTLLRSGEGLFAGVGGSVNPPADLSNDSRVLRAVALHQCCVCHEHLGQNTTALSEARHARRLVRGVLPEDDTLVVRLGAMERSIGNALSKSETIRPSTSPTSVLLAPL